MTTTAPLTTADLERMTRDDRWLGFGYLGERRNLRTYAIEETNGRRQLELMTQATRMDRDVIEEANAEGLTYDDLFTWANSKAGRWFADCYDTPHASSYRPTAARVASLRRHGA
jgi:hypothetical protein